MCQKPSFTARKVKAKQYERFTIHTGGGGGLCNFSVLQNLDTDTTSGISLLIIVVIFFTEKMETWST